MKQQFIMTVAGAAAALALAACGGAPTPSAGTSTGTTQPAAAASSPAAAQSPPANAWHGQVQNTTATAWCVVTKGTDENGNPLDAWEVVYQNSGPYNDALIEVNLDFYDSAGNLASGVAEPVDYSLTDSGGTPMEVSAGTTILGGTTVQSLGEQLNVAPANAATCTVVNIG